MTEKGKFILGLLGLIPVCLIGGGISGWESPEMTGKWKRILLVLGLIPACLICGSISSWEYTPRIDKQVVTEPIDGQLAYMTLRSRACLATGLGYRCSPLGTGSYYFDPDPNSDLPPLEPHSSFAEFYKRQGGLLEINGQESVLLTEAVVAHHLYPRWSPDRQMLAYASSDRDNPGICLADADGNNEECYPMDARCVGGLSWSPGGQQIALGAYPLDDGPGCGGDPEGWAIYFFDLDTHLYTMFTTNADSPSWSPDGQQIAFESYQDDDSEIYTVDLDGNNLRRITNDPADDHSPAWSPDGDRIAFLSDRGGGRVIFPDTYYPQKRIYIVDAEGEEAQVLISWSKDSIERFVWGE